MAVHLEVRFAVDDADLSALHRRAFGSDDPEHSPAQPWSSRLERHSLTWVGAFESGALVGFVHAVWDGGLHAFVLDTAVDPAFQRRAASGGVGRRLVDAVSTEAFRAGCTWVHVDYSPESADFYERVCGFRPTHAGLRSAEERPPTRRP